MSKDDIEKTIRRFLIVFVFTVLGMFLGSYLTSRADPPTCWWRTVKYPDGTVHIAPEQNRWGKP
jgi:hypothetical protein